MSFLTWTFLKWRRGDIPFNSLWLSRGTDNCINTYITAVANPRFCALHKIGGFSPHLSLKIKKPMSFLTWTFFIWRTRLRPIRTAAQITASIKILPAKLPPLYQKLTQKVKKLQLLGLPIKEIAKRLNVSKGTVENALKWARR